MSDLQPVDYSVPLANPFQSAIQGYGAGAAIRDDQQNQALKAQQQVAQQAQAQQSAQVLNSLLTNPNPTAADYARATLLVPGMKDQFKQSWEQLNADQQASHLADTSQWYAAIRSGQPNLAIAQMNQRADAMDAANGGKPTPQSQGLRTQAKVIEIHPEMGATTLGLMLSSLPGGDKVINGYTALGGEQRAQALAPSVLKKSEAEATIEGAKADVAPLTVGLGNRKTAEEIATAESQRQIAALNTQIAQANSETERGRLVLERDKLVAEQGQKLQDRQNAAQTTLDTVNQTLGTVNDVVNHPGLSSGTGTGGSLRAWFSSSDAADFRSKLDVLKSELTLGALSDLKQTGKNGASGLGALSDREGAMLSSAIANLDPSKQSEESFRNSLKVIQSTLQRTQAKVIGSGDLPTKPGTGAFVAALPDGTKVFSGDVNRLLVKFPGATRQQVMDYLQSGGK